MRNAVVLRSRSRLGAVPYGAAATAVSTFVNTRNEPTGSRIEDTAKATGIAVGASYAGAASAAAIGAAYGSVVPGLGTAIGAVIGLVAGELMKRNYLNVAQMNAAELQEVAAFQKYKTVAGQAAGRQFGFQVMAAVMKGCLHSGGFPKNNALQCFHEGCSKFPGNASLVDTILTGNSVDKNCFPDILPLWKAQKLGTNTTAATGNAQVRGVMAAGRQGPLKGLGDSLDIRRPLPMRRVLPPNMARHARRNFKGFGALGTAAATAAPALPDAVVFIDQFFVPRNSPGSPCKGTPCFWAAPSNALEHQILYDLADAYLNESAGILTTPYVASTAARQQGAAIAPVSAVTQVPALIATSATSIAAPVAPGYGPLPPTPVNATLSPYTTPALATTPPVVAASAGVATPVTAATSANLDAALAAQGFTRAGTTPDGVPLYSSAGQVYAYNNGGLYPYGTVAQLAATGNAGNGIGTPSTGLDPNVLNAIYGAIAQGMSAAQASQVGAQYLTQQGVPVTPTVQDQLDYAAQNPTLSSARGGISSGVLLVGGGVLLLLLMRK